MNQGTTLVVEGSTYAGSAAVFRDAAMLGARDLPAAPIPGRGGRDENFLPMVADVLREARVSPRELDRVVCGSGPGSFTSLRIAASIAKGLAVGASCPLFAVSSLALAVAEAKHGRYLVTLPAMRGEVYAGAFEVGGGGVVETAATRIIAESEIESECRNADAVHLVAVPHAGSAASLLDAVIAAGPCDIDSWEPTYGRLAEAQVKWEAAHGRALPVP